MKKWTPLGILLVLVVTCLSTSNTYFNHYQPKTDTIESTFYTSYSISPTTSNDYYSLALSYYHNEQYHSAIKHFKRAIDLDSKYSYTYYKIAECYAQIDNYEKALQNYNYFKLLNPENKKVYRVIARLEKKQQLHITPAHYK